ncbi:MAG: ribonuclease HIII [bacterium]
MNSYSQLFDLSKGASLKKSLELAGFEIKSAQYAVWQAKGNNVSATLYNSGKFLVQGKGTQVFIKDFLNVETVIQTKLIETDSPKILKTDLTPRIGTDESGKGDYFGPLVIAGVYVDEKSIPILESAGIKDSKKMTDKDIEKAAIIIKQNTVFTVVVLNPLKYNELYSKIKNLNNLLAWGHARAIENVLEKQDCANALADKFGNESLILNALMTKGKNIKLEQRVRAEEDIAVAAASILARNEFVKRMKALSSEYVMLFPKGCSSQVKQAAKAFVSKYSKDGLAQVAKLHFKTTLEI